MIHIWIEDSKDSSTIKFWSFLQKECVSDVLPNVDLVPFGSNANLVTAMKNYHFSTKDIYYIFLDNVVDNPDVVNLRNNAKKIAQINKNVLLSDLLCWVKPTKENIGYNYADTVRTEFIDCVDNNNLWITNRIIVEYVVRRWNLRHLDLQTLKKELQYITAEQIAYRLLCDIVNSVSADFVVTKTRLGTCWTCNCCDKVKKNNDKDKNKKKQVRCSLYRYKKNSHTKALNLLHCTVARKIVTEIKAAMK